MLPFPGIGGRDLRKMLKRMGLEIQELSNVDRVVIELPDKRLIIDAPIVSVISTKQGQKIFQIVGEPREETVTAAEEKLEIPEEDVQLVASQAGVSLEEARKALEATKGDIAQAIMLLEAKKASS